MPEILGRRTDHGRTANIDILDAILVTGAGRHCRRKRIKIDANEIDWGNAVFFHLAQMSRKIATPQNATMYLRHQRLDATIKDFREAGMFGNILDCQTRLTQRPCRAPRRKQFCTVGCKCTPQVNQSRLVRDGEKGATNGESGLSHDGTAISFKTCPCNRW